MAIEQIDSIKTDLSVTGLVGYERDLSQAARAVEAQAKAHQQNEAALRRADAATSQMQKSTSALAASLQALAAVGIGAALDNQVKSMVGAAAQMEAYQAQFEVLTGSVSQAKAEIERLTDFAAKTPFDLPGVISAGRLIKAFSLDVGGSEKTLRLFGDAAAAMGKPIEQLITVAQKAKAGQFDIAEMGAVAFTREKAMAGGVKFSGAGEVQNREQLWSAFIKHLETYAGTMEKVSKTTGGKLTNLSDSLIQFNAAVGKTLTPALKPLLDGFTGVLTAAQKLDPSLLRLAGIVVVVGSGLAKLAAISQGWLVLQRLNVVAANTSSASLAKQATAQAATSVSTGQLAAAETLEADIASARALGLGPKVIAQLEAEALARRQVAVAAEQQAIAQAGAAATGGAGGAAAAGGLLGRMKGGIGKALPFIRGSLPWIGVALVANDLYGKATAGNAAAGDSPVYANPWMDIAAGAMMGSRFGPWGTAIGTVAGVGYAGYDLAFANRRNDEIMQADEDRDKADARSSGWREKGQAVQAAKDAEAKAKAEAEYIANLEKGVKAHEEMLSRLDAQTRIAGYRTEQEADIIPYIQQQVEGARQYEKLLTDLVAKLPQTEEGEKKRAEASKELLSTTVERAGMERKIRDLVKEQAEARFKELQFIQEIKASVAQQQADKFNRNQAGMLAAAVAGGQNATSVGAIQDAWRARYAQIESTRFGSVLGKTNPGEIAAINAEAAAQQRGLSREQFMFGANAAKSTLELVTGARSAAEQFGATISELRQFDSVVEVARQAVARFYQSDMMTYGVGTPERASAVSGLQALEQAAAADALKRKEQEAKVFSDIFFSRVEQGAARMGKAFMGEIQQSALNSPAGLSELLPSYSTLARTAAAHMASRRRMSYGAGLWENADLDLPSMARPGMGNTVMQFQVNISGTRQEILSMIMSEVTRALDEQLPMEAAQYSMGGGD